MSTEKHLIWRLLTTDLTYAIEQTQIMMQYHQQILI